MRHQEQQRQSGDEDLHLWRFEVNGKASLSTYEKYDLFAQSLQINEMVF
jgi:hypothetical protein